jgi:hypothetical protein
MALFGRSKREFLREFLRLEQDIPSHDTFSRVWDQETSGDQEAARISI